MAGSKGERGSVLRVLWQDLPLLNFVAYAATIAHAEIANLDPPRFDYVWTFVFPLAVPALIFALRWRTAGWRDRTVMLAVLAAAPALISLVWSFGVRTVISNDALRLTYEYSAIANTALLLVHAWGRDRSLVPLMMGPVAAYGLLLENGGIALG